MKRNSTISVATVSRSQKTIHMIRQLIASSKNFEMVAEVKFPAILPELNSDILLDIVVLDFKLTMDGGHHVIRRIRQCWGTSIRILALLEEEQDLASAICAGADGCLLKQVTVNCLHDAMRSLLDSGAVISPALVLQAFVSIRESTQRTAENILSDRELDTLNCFIEGLTYAETANKLGVKKETIKEYAKRIYWKIADLAERHGEFVSGMSRAKAVSIALRYGVVAGVQRVV
jgi:DNA-binding NarL/FixJ family response regulator